jgi:hypothetical protein
MTSRIDRAVADALVDAAEELSERGETLAAVSTYQRAIALLDGDDPVLRAARIRCSSLLADLGRDAEAAAMLR